jgi:hypothetical protein
MMQKTPIIHTILKGELLLEIHMMSVNNIQDTVATNFVFSPFLLFVLKLGVQMCHSIRWFLCIPVG